MEATPDRHDRPGSDGTELGSRRRKRGLVRLRVTRACDRCKRKKIRCTGAQPCEICIRAGGSCTYNASYSRGRIPSVVTANSGARDPSVGDDQGFTIDQDTEILDASDVMGEIFEHPHSRTTVPSSRTSPEPSQTDRQGHYVGPASGVSFLLRVQKRLHQTLTFSQNASIFTFGDAPLPEIDPSFFVMPPRDEAQRLVDRYFDFAVPTHRFLHRPTINAWLDEFFNTLGTMGGRDDAPARTALLFMVFAQARDARYFLMAEHQLSKERGTVRLTSVQARLCQCFYLLSLSRMNHCWTLFGTMAHLALAIGLNRNRRADPAGGFNNIDIECRRRVFWCAYTLDNYLSAALGRPRTFHDPDIDAELPSCVDDLDLMTSPPVAPPFLKRGQTIMFAPVAHVKLSRIVGVILRDLYPIRPLSTSSRIALTAKCSADLQNWYGEMARFLDVDGVNTALLLPLYQRQRNVLNLAYWHATILTHRPFLLSNFARLQQSDSLGRALSHGSQAESSSRECLNAAMNIVQAVDELVQTQQMFRAFWFTSYFAFCAVVVLYVYVIQQSSSPPEKFQAYLDAAANCQSQVAALAEKESLAQRYCLVLEELRLEAVRHVENAQRTKGVAFQEASEAHGPLPIGQEVNGLLHGDGNFDHLSPIADLNASPSSSLADITSWGNFDSMVTSGFGHLDALLHGGETFAF
ncbi:hypothetical protein GQ53DRAFT_867005 [Thozetella sp. PMI_491]|nr:hypothetical protein GQ53DRAFT_867005 [Thozetella sp. PMI_491]